VNGNVASAGGGPATKRIEPTAAQEQRTPQTGQSPKRSVLTAPAQCLADANHCCMPDGTLVIAGGCSPASEGVLGGVEHGAGGWCETVACDAP
jgi:hypothetical protein